MNIVEEDQAVDPPAIVEVKKDVSEVKTWKAAGKDQIPVKLI